MDNDYHGALTYAFVKAVDRTQGKITYQQIIREVREQVKMLTSAQTPQLEGPTSRLRLKVFQ